MKDVLSTTMYFSLSYLVLLLVKRFLGSLGCLFSPCINFLGNKVPQMGWLKTTGFYPLMEARSLSSRSLEGRVLPCLLSFCCRSVPWLPGGSLSPLPVTWPPLTRLFSFQGHQPFGLRTLLIQYDFILTNYMCKTLIPNRATLEGTGGWDMHIPFWRRDCPHGPPLLLHTHRTFGTHSRREFKPIFRGQRRPPWTGMQPPFFPELAVVTLCL